MNYFTAHHLEVAGALARPGDDGAPPAVTRPQAGDGQGHHPMRLGAAPGR
jgi:hypothetical protein